MKINSLVAKTALAAAIAGASFAASAGELIVPTPSIVATEVFGDAKNTASESNLTAITLPEMQFFATSDLVTKAAGVGSATIKLTLLGDTLFSENYQDPSLWAAKGIVVAVDGIAIDETDILSVDDGTGNSNTITITLKDSDALTAGPANLDPAAQTLQNIATDPNPAVSIKGFKVTRLKSALETPGEANVTIEVRAFEEVNAATTLLASQAFENTPSEAAIVSTDGVVIAGTKTDYVGGAGSSRAYIQVGDAQQSFTDVAGNPTAHRDDYDAKDDVLELGTLSLKRGVVAPLRPGAGEEAGKETGTLFDFTGADILNLSIAGSAPLTGYGLELRTDNCSNVGNATNLLSAAIVSTTDPNTATFAVNTSDTNLDAPVAWNLCGKANVTGTDRIPQLNSLNASFTVEYGNIRYGESKGSYDYGPVLRNGCQVTLFNVPNVNAGDKAMIRLSNTSDRAGQVNAYAYLQDGTLVDQNALLLDNLPAHGTQVFSTQQGVGVYLGEEMPVFGAETEGRARIVIQGAFPSCEALGLVRSGGGVLTNMTSTTNSDSDTAAVGTYGTSNTGN